MVWRAEVYWDNEGGLEKEEEVEDAVLLGLEHSDASSTSCFRAKGEHPKRFQGLLSQSQGRDMVVTVLYVP